LTAPDVIAIRHLAVDCVVGVYPHERDTPQPLVLDVELSLDTEAAARAERLSRTIDYDFTARQIAFLLQNCRFRLLETAAHALAKYLLAPPPQGIKRAPASSLRLRLTKPEALGGEAVPSLEIVRDADWATFSGREDTAFGTVDVIHETQDAGIYRLNVAPGRGIPLHVHRVMNEAEMVLGTGLRCQGRPVARGTVHRWPHDAPHFYENPTDKVQTILCVDSPRFIPDDEIPVDAEPAEVQPEPPWTPRRAP
jgi:dihydroneopterin aldolase